MKSLQIADGGEAVEKREPFYTVGGKVNGYSHCGKQYGGVHKEQINQDGSGQAISMHGLLLLPHILQIHGYITAKINYSTAHTCHNVPAWPRTTFVL